jgi:hypothetical protein
MSFRAILSARSVFSVSRSALIVRSFATRTRFNVGTVARNGFRGPQIRGFQSSVVRAFPAPQEGKLTIFIKC